MKRISLFYFQLRIVLIQRILLRKKKKETRYGGNIFSKQTGTPGKWEAQTATILRG